MDLKTPPNMKIIPIDKIGSSKTDSLSSKLTMQQITNILGFPPNCQDDVSKVKYSWGFEINGHHCGIWDYKGSRWSVYDPRGALRSSSIFEGFWNE
jgi:hypothetical protein